MYGDGSKVRDFTHVHDITDALLLVMKKNPFGYEFDLGRGQPHSISEISEMFGVEFKREEDRKGEVQSSVCENRMASDVLGWEPFRNINDYIKLGNPKDKEKLNGQKGKF